MFQFKNLINLTRSKVSLLSKLWIDNFNYFVLKHEVTELPVAHGSKVSYALNFVIVFDAPIVIKYFCSAWKFT